MAVKRCFIAIEVPEGVKKKLAGLQLLLQAWPARVKWVEEENVHLTMKFLGDISSGQIEAIKQQLLLIGKDSKVFEIQISGLGCFPNMQAPKVIWAGLHDRNGNLVKLRNEIEEKLAVAGFPKETKKFSPHLTLGRVKDLFPHLGLNEIIKNISVDNQTLKIGEIRLMESVLTPRGPEYSCIHAVKLQEHYSKGENIH